MDEFAIQQWPWQRANHRNQIIRPGEFRSQEREQADQKARTRPSTKRGGNVDSHAVGDANIRMSLLNQRPHADQLLMKPVQLPLDSRAIDLVRAQHEMASA